MHVSLVATRLKDVEKVRANLHRFATREYLFRNLAASCRPHQRIHNLDASLSLPRLLMEMLVFSRPGYIELLPVWPNDYPDGWITGVLVRGGHKMDLTWAGGKAVSVTLHAGRDDSGTIVSGAVKHAFEFKAGQGYRFDGQLRVQSMTIIR